MLSLTDRVIGARTTVEETKKNSFDKKLPGGSPDDRGSGTFMLNDLYMCVLFFFSSSLHLSRSLVRDSGRNLHLSSIASRKAQNANSEVTKLENSKVASSLPSLAQGAKEITPTEPPCQSLIVTRFPLTIW